MAASVSVSQPARGIASPQLLAWTTASWQTSQTLTLTVDSQARRLLGSDRH